MNDINSVVMTGRLTKEPEIRTSKSGMEVLKMSLASNASVKKGDKWEDEVGFYDWILFGKRAMSLSPMLKKGQLITVSGRAKWNKWVDGSGKNRTGINFITDNVIFASEKKKQEQTFDDSELPADLF